MALKVVQSLLQSLVSKPEGPAAPVVLMAADLIMAASTRSKTVGCMSKDSSPCCWRAVAETGWQGGCFLLSTSITESDSPLLEGMVSLGCRTPPLPRLQISWKADLVLPSNMRFAKERARRCSSSDEALYFGRRCCRAFPSFTSSRKSPSFQNFKRRSTQEI